MIINCFTMLFLAMLNVKLHCFSRYHADGSVKISCTPEFLTPKLVPEQMPMMLSHHVTRKSLKLVCQFLDAVFLPVHKKCVEVVWSNIHRRYKNSKLLGFFQEVDFREFSHLLIHEDISSICRG